MPSSLIGGRRQVHVPLPDNSGSEKKGQGGQKDNKKRNAHISRVTVNRSYYLCVSLGIRNRDGEVGREMVW